MTFLALSVYPRIGISLSAPELDVRFYLSHTNNKIFIIPLIVTNDLKDKLDLLICELCSFLSASYSERNNYSH